MARTAEVKRDARMGEAEARRDAQIKVYKPFYTEIQFSCYICD